MLFARELAVGVLVELVGIGVMRRSQRLCLREDAVAVLVQGLEHRLRAAVVAAVGGGLLRGLVATASVGGERECESRGQQGREKGFDLHGVSSWGWLCDSQARAWRRHRWGSAKGATFSRGVRRTGHAQPIGPSEKRTCRNAKGAECRRVEFERRKAPTRPLP